MMAAEPSRSSPATFFVSHADTDVEWAEWVAAELEVAGYGVAVKAWDFLAGENILERIDEALARCTHTIAIVSSGYLASEIAVRTAAQHQGLDGKARALIPVRVEDCDLPATLRTLIPIDLRDVDEAEARKRLRKGVSEERRGGDGTYPGKKQPKKKAGSVRFPPAASAVWELRGQRPDPNFIGRNDVLVELHHAFRAGNTTSSIQAVTGLWGLGKTRVAIEYAYRHAAAYDVVWWVRAENNATLQGDYIELAPELGLPYETASHAIAALRRHLRQLKNCLLVFDNAEDPDELFALLPDRLAGHVLITSQRRDWPHVETRRLEVLPTETATEYLVARGKMADHGTARDVAEALGGLPLALTQAASVIAEGVEVGEYLAELQKNSPELFEQGFPFDYRRTVFSTWRASFTRLRDESSTAGELLRLGAFLAPEAIPLTALRPASGTPDDLVEILTDPLRRHRATRALAEYSLAETADGLLSIHRLVQAVTRADLGDDERKVAERAVRVMAASQPDDVTDPDQWATCESLLGHAIASVEHGDRLDVDVVARCALRNRVARYLFERGRRERAEAILSDALASTDRLGPDEPVLFDCRNTWGRLLQERGEYLTALSLQESVYRFRYRALGADDIETLRAGSDLASVLDVQGQWAAARELQDHVVERLTAVVGPEHPDYLSAISRQADMLRDAGDFRRARELNEQVLTEYRRQFGDDHLKTLLATSGLAATLSDQGDLTQAQELASYDLEARRTLLGAEHPATLSSMGNLAVILWRQGALARARGLEQQVLDDRQRLLGADHPDTLLAMQNLAATLRLQGEFDGARDLAEREVEASGQLLGMDHPATLRSSESLARILLAQEDDKAAAMLEHILQARKELLGDDHPETLRAVLLLASAVEQAGDLDTAITMFEDVRDQYRTAFGDEHPMQLDAAIQLSRYYSKRGDTGAARNLAERTMSTFRRLFGDTHLDSLAAMINFAVILVDAGDPEAADTLLVETLDVCVKYLGTRNSLASEISWILLSLHDGPHDAARRRTIQMNLSWLAKAAPNNLTAEQKSILDALRKSGLMTGGGSTRRKRRGR